MRYKVRLSRNVVLDAFIEIESDSDTAAEGAAIDLAMSGEDVEWREIDSETVSVTSSIVVSDDPRENEDEEV
jgi:hypothetical protein